MTAHELAVEFTEIWEELGPREINDLLSRNVPVELLEFFSRYAEQFAVEADFPDLEETESCRQQLPNLLIIGYLIRLLEERVD